MKRFVILMMCMICLVPAGCMRQSITEDEFLLLWQEYLTREFTESFDEAQSFNQRQQILNSVLQEYNVNQKEYYEYLKSKHPDKYTIFVVNPESK